MSSLADTLAALTAKLLSMEQRIEALETPASPVISETPAVDAPAIAETPTVETTADAPAPETPVVPNSLKLLPWGYTRFYQTDPYSGKFGDPIFDQLVVYRPAGFPESPAANGWKISGEGVPEGTTIVNYRFGKDNDSDRIEAIYVDLSDGVNSLVLQQTEIVDLTPA